MATSIIEAPAPYTIATLDRLRALAVRGMTVESAALALGWSASRVRKVAFHHGILFDLPATIDPPTSPVRRSSTGDVRLAVRTIGFEPSILAALQQSADRAGVTLQVRVRELLAEALLREALLPGEARSR